MKARASIVAVGIVLGSAAHTWAGDGAGAAARPPFRPLPMTAAQYTALHELAASPEHADVSSLRASYSPEAERALVEWGALGSQAVVPTAIIVTLICAAPL